MADVVVGNLRAWASTESTALLSGKLVTGGGLGFAVASRVRRSGAAARRQVRTPGQARTDSPPLRPRELADARTVTTRATRASHDFIRGQSPWPSAEEVAWPAPNLP